MTPEPEEHSLVSKIIIVGVILILILVIGSCAYIIYGYMQPANMPAVLVTPSPTVTPTPTPFPTPSPTPYSNATATPTPSEQPGANATVDPDDSGIYEQDTQVTSGNFTFYDPGVWNNYIVYDMFDGMKNYSMLYDADTGKTQQLDSGTVFSYGAIGDGKVVLYYPLNGNKIYLYNIQTGETDLTSMNDDSTRNSITMSDTKLAYYEDIGHSNPDGSWDPDYSIYVFDLVMGQTASVIDNIPKPLDMCMYDNELVYTVVDGTGSDVYYLDLSDQHPSPEKISTNSGDNNHARIYGNWIVYYSDYSGSNHIYLYNIQSGQTTEPAPNSEQQSADIYGTTVVYDDNRYGNWDIFSYDVNTHAETQLTNEPHDQEYPVIYGNRIAYMDDRAGPNDWQIYTMTIPS
jgi:beta propeller repeat protein